MEVGRFYDTIISVGFHSQPYTQVLKKNLRTGSLNARICLETQVPLDNYCQMITEFLIPH